MTASQPERGELPWTGERYVPQLGGRVAVEHLHRYAYAARRADAVDVLDIACGEGYGSHMLASVARKVVGVDLCTQAIEHATQRYTATNLTFIAGSCAAIPCADHSFDLVVSFETIEHHDQHEEMMREIKRVLRPAGLLLISSPDRQVYSEKTGYINPFHVKELSKQEFAALLQRHFTHVSMLDQGVTLASVIAPTHRQPCKVGFSRLDENGNPAIGGPGAQPYLLAFASDVALPEIEADLCDASIWMQSELENAVRAMQTRLEELERRLLAHLPTCYQVGDVVDFCRMGNAERYLHAGWDIATDGGCWTLLPQATLRMSLANGWPQSQTVCLEIEAQGLVSDEHPSTLMTLMINGHPVGDHAFSGREVHCFVIPPTIHSIGDRSWRVDFLVANPVSPLQLGLSEDGRELGLLLTRMRVVGT